jgi:glycerophosphoryl diester phosphodiesterase
MIELKSTACPQPQRRSETLRQLLAPLSPVQDFHILSLEPKMFGITDFVPKQALVLVSMANTRRISATAIDNGYGGVAGHFAFLRDRLLARHHAQGQHVGTGFICSRNCLFRELNRGIEWIVSNHAVELQRICNQA